MKATTGKKVIVKLPIVDNTTEKRTKGGIILPGSAAKDEYTKAKVVLVGPEVQTVNKDDTVLFPTHLGTEIEYGGSKFKVLQEQEITIIE